MINPAMIGARNMPKKKNHPKENNTFRVGGETLA